MLPTVRRVVASSAVVPPAAVAAALAWSSSSASSSSGAPGQLQLTQPARKTPAQRRYSSSKPSGTDNGSKSLPGVPSESSSSSNSSNANADADASSPSQKAKPAAPKRSRRKAKDAGTTSGTMSGATSGAAAKKTSVPSPAAPPATTSTATRASTLKQKLPSVPSTQHLPLETVALSAFFSQHRPISITHSLPKVVSDDAFAAIFAPRARGSKTSEVISTLSRAVGDLEGPLAALSVGGQPGTARSSRRAAKASAASASAAEARHQLQLQLQLDQDAAADDEAVKMLLKNADGSDAEYYMQAGAPQDSYMPFHPPPPPVPEGKSGKAIESGKAIKSGEAGTDLLSAIEAGTDLADLKLDVDVVFDRASGVTEGSSRIFKAVLTIEEQVDANGDVQIVAHTPQILDETASAQLAAATAAATAAEPVPRSFFERMALRQLRFDDARAHQRLVRRLQRFDLPAALEQAPAMQAISVKRQRKLKMKKKKFKKLMRKTRNLRRKLDRA